ASQYAHAVTECIHAQHVEDGVAPLINRGSIDCALSDTPVSKSVRRGRLDEAERQISGCPESVPLPADQDAIDSFRRIDPRITWLKQLDREELRSVTNHLEQLDQYIQALSEGTTGTATGELQTLVQPLFQVTPAHPSPRKLSGQLADLFTRKSKNPVNGELREIIISHVIPVWKELQEKFINLACHSPWKDPDIKLNFLKSLFVLGDYFHTNKLVGSKIMNEVEIFKPKIVVNLIDFYVQLLIQSKGDKLFESSEWVTPQIDLLIDNPSLSHFRRSIRALQDDDRRYLVYRTLRSVLENHKTLLPRGDFPSPERVVENFQRFLRINFIEPGKDRLINPYDADINSNYNNAFYNIMNSFDLQGSPPDPDQEIQGFQALLSYCILDFGDKYHRDTSRRFLPLSSRSAIVSVCLEEKLYYLGCLLNLRQNGFKDSTQKSDVKNGIKTLKKAAHQSGNYYYSDERVKKWIDRIDNLFGENQANAIVVVAFYIFKASQYAHAVTECIHAQHVEDDVAPLINRGSIDCALSDTPVPKSVRRGGRDEAERQISGCPGSVTLPVNQGQFLKPKDSKGCCSLLLELTLPHMYADAIDWSKNIDPRITRLKELGREELNGVTTHLKLLDQYVQAQAEATTGAVTREPQTLVEPVFQVTPAQASPQRSSSLVGLFTKKSSKNPELDEELREIIITAVIPVWKDLQEKFIKLACHSPEKEPDIKLNFLKSLFVLGDYFYSNNLVRSKIMDEVEIFKPNIVVNLIDFHVKLSIQSKGNKLFESSEWVTPQIDLLIDNPSLRHFRRSIQALSGDNRVYLVYCTLRSVLGKYDSLLPRGDFPNPERMGGFIQRFLRINFIEPGKDRLINPYNAGINSDYSTAFYAIMNCFDLQGDILASESRGFRLYYHTAFCAQFPSARFRSEIMSVSYERQRKLFYLGYLLNLRQNGFKGSERKSHVKHGLRMLKKAARESDHPDYVQKWIGTINNLFQAKWRFW
ncbi:hypothetical protein PSTT_11261, partial [Puccinia striiformis]